MAGRLLFLTRRAGNSYQLCLNRLCCKKQLHYTIPVLSDEVSPRGPPYTTDLTQASSPDKNLHLRPIYRILNNEGIVLDSTQDPNLDKDLLLQMYSKMLTLQLMDQYLYRAQRMGLISFYMMNYGEEGTHFGTAAALDSEDVVYAQYREAGVLMWRGFTLDDMMNQCFSNNLDKGRGRQMPVHYGSKEHNFHFISSPLATQIPQAPGYAYGMKIAGSKNCVIVYFGDGAAQEGDCHAAMNFAATLKCPVIFLCRNNGYAISTPVEDQYAGDGIVDRGIGYGMEAIRVDGNDVLAMYNATKHAKQVCVEEGRPVLIEAMTYRLGSHSTSDDQSLYQDMDAVEYWKNNLYPVTRLKLYLVNKGWLEEEKTEELVKSIDEDIKASFQQARKIKKPPINDMFSDVYDTLSPRLRQQRQELWDHLKEYGHHYPMKDYEPSSDSNHIDKDKMAYEGGEASYRGGGNVYGVPSAPTGQAAPLFEDTSSRPSFPSIGAAQQFLSNPMVTEAALQYGQGLVYMGQSYLDRGVNRFAPGIKQYFSVDTNYVLNKLWIILFPYTHRDWSLQYSGNDPVEPRRDINAPDLYIPAMGFVTYVLLNGFVLGTQKRFTPEVLGISASSLFAWLVIEVLLIWLSMFLCRVTARLTWMDILAYCSYKYVSMIFSVGVSLMGGAIAYYIALAWSTAAIAYFEVQTLRLRVQPDITEGSSRIRNYLLLIIAIIQPLLILWLTWSLVKYQPPPTLNKWEGF